MGTFVGCCFFFFFCVLLIPVECAKFNGTLDPGFQGSRMAWVDDNGIFLHSYSSNFAFGFQSYDDPTAFSLVVVHWSTKTVVWTANPDTPVSDSDMFVFDKNGTAFLRKGGGVIWSTGSSRAGASRMELRDSGNLVLLGSGNETVWESFGHPTDTLLSNQAFVKGMRLASRAKSKSSNLSYALEIDSGDMVLFADYGTRQPYWSMSRDSRKIMNNAVSGAISSASIRGDSWRFYDRDGKLVWDFLLSGNPDLNATWVAVLGGDGVITFSKLQSGSRSPSPTRIPTDPCGTPESCDPYMVCYSSNRCRCVPALSSGPTCGPGIIPACDPKTGPVPGKVDLVSAGEGIGYSALAFVHPTLKSDLNNCKSSCLGNCSCLALFFESSSGNCFLFDKIGSLQDSGSNSSGFISYIKVSSSGSVGGKNRVPYIVAIALSTTLIIVGLLVYAGWSYVRRGEKPVMEVSLEDGSGEEDDFLENLSGAPNRFSYKELESATSNFSVKLGHGGFGTVYHGTLPDGTQVAVKKLESIGQGKKEFRSEVSTIGSIHHHHLVRLKGFCAQGSHRLLVYEYMPKGSLDKWIFRKNKKNNNEEEEQQSMVLTWEIRYKIALGTAKGLAYLHQDCDSKIVHCDIKPENVLLDENFLAKVSDFGLAKLMDREQSHVFTTLRGTRGYLAPEWITNQAISEKSDVYSYGMVLIELIGGRKSFDPEEASEKAYFPSYAFKMIEEGKIQQVLDSSLKFDEKDETVLRAIKVALWCVQEDMSLRPPMAKVVQMLEGVSQVAQPPVSSPLGYRLNSRFYNLMINDNTSSGTGSSSDCNADSYLSNVQLSGPR